MVKVITGEQSQRRKRRTGKSKTYSYGSREGATGGAVTAGSGRADHQGNRRIDSKSAAKAPERPGE